MEATVWHFVKKDKIICRKFRRLDKLSFLVSFDIGFQSLWFHRAKNIDRIVRWLFFFINLIACSFIPIFLGSFIAWSIKNTVL